MIELACSQFWSCLHLDYWCFLLLLPGRKPFYVTIDSWDREDVCVWLPPSVRGRGSAKTHKWLRWNDYGRTWLMALPPIGLLEDWEFLHADDQEVCSILHFRTTGFPVSMTSGMLACTSSPISQERIVLCICNCMIKESIHK